MFHLKNNGLHLRHNKTIEPCSFSHSSNQQVYSCLRLILHLKVRTPSNREHCVLPKETRKVDVACMILKYRKFSSCNYYSISSFCVATVGYISFGYSGSGWIGNDIKSNSKKFPISGRIGLQNPDPVRTPLIATALRTSAKIFESTKCRCGFKLLTN